MHRHRVADSVVRRYSHPIPTAERCGPENGAAHGNITTTETCLCGATRRANINGRHVEQGRWVEPQSDPNGHNGGE